MTDDFVRENSGGRGRARGADKTSESLLVRIGARDEEAWTQFVELYEPLVRLWCRGLGVREADVPDVTQEVFGTVARSIETFHYDRKGDTFRGWLRTITRSRALDAFRKNKRNASAVGGSDVLNFMLALPAEPSDTGTSDEDDRRMLVRRAVELILGKFEEKTRQAFLRVVIGGEHPAVVAEDLGMTDNAVYLATSRIKRKIRQELAELIDI